MILLVGNNDLILFLGHIDDDDGVDDDIDEINDELLMIMMPITMPPSAEEWWSRPASSAQPPLVPSVPAQAAPRTSRREGIDAKIWYWRQNFIFVVYSPC